MISYPLPTAADHMQVVSSTALNVTDIVWTDFNDKAYTANSLDIFVETNSIRWLDNWLTPTAANWHLAAATWVNVVSLRWCDISNLQVIRATWSDATISIRVWYTKTVS